MNENNQTNHRNIKRMVYVSLLKFSLKILNIYYVKESICFELKVGSKICNLFLFIDFCVKQVMNLEKTQIIPKVNLDTLNLTDFSLT